MTKSPVEAARRVWERGGKVTSNEDVATTAQRVCEELRLGLSRWVGVEGYRALFDRALLIAAAEHPVLNNFPCNNGDAAAALEAARAHGADQLARAIVALVATLTDLLGRILGEEMASQLVERTATLGPRAGSSTDSRGGRNG